MSNIETTILRSENNLYEYKPVVTPINYPLIRYMGSKYKLLEWINSELSQLEFNTVLDGFSGSGAVSYMLKKMNKTVYTNDFLHFSYILAKATTENSFQRISENDLIILHEHNDKTPDFIQKTFTGIFYTEDELKYLDMISYNIKKLSNQYKKSVAMSALIRSCIKKQPRGVFTISGNMEKYNDGRRDLRLTVKEHFLEQVKVYNGVVFNNSNKNKAFYGDIFEFNNKIYNPDLVYLDPPYVPRSDDNCYVKRYHFLEGLSKYWKNEEIDFNTKVHKIKKKYTPFSYRKTAISAFDELFDKFKNSIIVLSYSSNGYPDLSVLEELLGKYKKNVAIKKKNHKYHFGNHKSVKRSNVEEYLIIGR